MRVPFKRASGPAAATAVDPVLAAEQRRRVAAWAETPPVVRNGAVDDYIAAMPQPLRAVAERARRVIDANLEGADAAIRWAHPTWSLGKTPVCYLRAASKHVTFGFWHGASIDDPSGRLESSGNVMAHVKLRTEEDVDPELFASWLHQARAIELARAG